MTERVSHHGYNACFEVLEAGVSPLDSYAGCEAILLGRDSTVPDELQSTSRLDGFTDLDEYVDASYARLAVTNLLVTPQAYGLRIKCDDLVWAALDYGGTNKPGHVLIAQKLEGAASDAEKIPFVLLEWSFLPNGTTATYAVPTRGILVLPGEPS